MYKGPAALLGRPCHQTFHYLHHNICTSCRVARQSGFAKPGIDRVDNHKWAFVSDLIGDLSCSEKLEKF